MWADRPKRLMPDGANLAVLFGGMSAAERDRFNTLLQEALGYSLSLRSGTGNAELTLTNPDGDTFNIADLGFGLSQVLPVYLQAHLARRSLLMSHRFTSLFVVEQPELHLHPQLQAKLADLFVGMSAQGQNNPDPVPCFVETHSKALLERVGELVEAGAIPADDVQVLLFEKDGKDCTVRATTFDEQGILRDWPVGFLSR
jgi:predicted ATPase